MPAFGLTSKPVYVILGSGGHTSEMVKIIQALFQLSEEPGYYKPQKYLLATTDTTSKVRFKKALEESINHHIEPDAFIEVPRSREVGQSWLSTIFTTLYAFIWSFWLIFRDQPRLILCNGPSTCVPFCIAAYLWRLAGRLERETKIIFIESFCRVHTLSLSGKILLHFVDLFVVQWQPLADKYGHRKNVKYFGNII
uniref:UDP-N-acetylglucosamine transferase subunit ALG14 n=1 Tax=Glossina pallidipes TaxID=7398 RepID=A0A1A9ZIG4_GLOPL